MVQDKGFQWKGFFFSSSFSASLKTETELKRKKKREKEKANPAQQKARGGVISTGGL